MVIKLFQLDSESNKKQSVKLPMLIKDMLKKITLISVQNFKNGENLFNLWISVRIGGHVAEAGNANACAVSAAFCANFLVEEEIT